MPAELEDDDLMDDSEGSDDLSSDLEEISADDEDGEVEDGEGEGDEDDDALSLVEGSNAEDLLSLDAEVPMGLIDYDGPDASGDDSDTAGGEWGGITSGKPIGGKRKREEDGRKAQRKKLRALPTFASYEDYAKLIEDGPEDNI